MRRIGPAASEKKSFENVDDGRTTDGRRMPLYTKSSPTGELKNNPPSIRFQHLLKRRSHQIVGLLKNVE